MAGPGRGGVGRKRAEGRDFGEGRGHHIGQGRGRHDGDRIIGILASRSRRAERNEPPVELNLLLTRYDPARVSKGEMLTVEDVKEILSIPLLGVIPESESVLRASNTGTPVAFDSDSLAGRAYLDAVARFLGEQREMRFVKPERRGFFPVLFGRA